MEPFEFKDFTREIDAGAVQGIIDLQKTLIAPAGSSAHGRGFLVGILSEADIRKIVSRGKAYCAFAGRSLAGYLLIAHIDEFTEFLRPPYDGVFESSGSVSYEDCDYLFQIGVSLSHGKSGLGSALMRRCLAERSRALITDAVFEPLNNEASFRFFLKNGFERVGTLTLSRYKDYGVMRSHVLRWRK